MNRIQGATDMRILLASAIAAPLCMIWNGAMAQGSGPVKPIVVTAIKGDAAPKLDGIGDDAVWKKAQLSRFTAIKGVNFKDNGGTTNGTIQIAYVGDTIYFLLTYEDPTQSFRRSPFVKGQDGKWTKLTDPDDKGGDNNKVYEDKFAMMWNINDSIFAFTEKMSCQAACHAGEPGKPFGNKYTSDETELGDIWHMKTVRTGSVGQVDNQYVDSTRFDPAKAPDAGRKSDANTGGGYADIKLVDGKPEFMNKDAKPANKSGNYWLKAEDKAPFDDSKYVPGDEVASIMVSPFAGDRGAISSAMKWADGKWTFEFARKMTTGSKFDVQFSDLARTYGFGIAVYDNAQVRHAYVPEPMHLVFQK
jgi:hypothetical protein